MFLTLLIISYIISPAFIVAMTKADYFAKDIALSGLLWLMSPLLVGFVSVYLLLSIIGKAIYYIGGLDGSS